MKKVFTILTAIATLFTSCEKESTNDVVDNNKVVAVTVEATSKTTWHYYNFEQEKFIGTGETAQDEAWAKRTDWDLAICRYKVRTNSGTSGVGKSGTYTCNDKVKFNSLDTTPADAKFTADISYTEEVMGGGVITESRSTAVVSIMDGMPPVWKKSPLYVIPNSSGEKHYKVDFLAYKNAEGASGHVSFKFSSLTK